MAMIRRGLFRDYGLIALALAGIFACGLVIGRRSAPAPSPPAATLDDGRWETAALTALERELALEERQLEPVRQALAGTAGELREVRDAALTESHAILIDLIDRLLPVLEPEQQKALERDRLRLQRVLVERSAPEGGLQPFRKSPAP